MKRSELRQWQTILLVAAQVLARMHCSASRLVGSIRTARPGTASDISYDSKPSETLPSPSHCRNLGSIGQRLKPGISPILAARYDASPRRSVTQSMFTKKVVVPAMNHPGSEQAHLEGRERTSIERGEKTIREFNPM
jgi:hypothetical protein